MGYYTRYSLKVERKQLHEYEKERINKIKTQAKETEDPDVKRILEEGVYKLEQEAYFGPGEKIAKEIGYNPCDDSCKWYDHESDMASFSKKYPESLFVLKGEGEESGDIWIKYFLNGKMQRAEAKITFEEFDESKLS
jgi:hypothetical protein